MTRAPAAIAAIGLLSLASACARPNGEFPSLAMRPGEQDISVEEPVRVAPAYPDDPALAGRIAALLGQAREGQRAFAAADGRAASAVAQAGGRGSDSWTAAQEAVSTLEAARAPTTRALGDLDQLLVARAGQPTSAADFARLNAAKAEAQGLAAAQTATLDGYIRRLGLP